jgi:hypothetical protein
VETHKSKTPHSDDGADPMYEHMPLPRARHDGLLEETLGEELLLYDQSRDTAHCLSPIAASVWRHCDGEHDIAGLARLTGAGESLVLDALHELSEKDLLDAAPKLMPSTSPGESRREAIVRVGRYGAAAAAGSMIVSATAATPAMATSSEPVCCQCFDNLGGRCNCAPCESAEKCKEHCENAGLCVGKTTSLCETGFECRNTGFCAPAP